MKIDTGLAVVIVAVLIFYMRLIILQRERVKRAGVISEANAGKKKKAAGQAAPSASRYSILSPNRRDWVIAGIGAAAVLLGALFYLGALPVTAGQAYWWIPTSIGIVAFSWAFKL